jgi:hypothetical protein
MWEMRILEVKVFLPSPSRDVKTKDVKHFIHQNPLFIDLSKKLLKDIV